LITSEHVNIKTGHYVSYAVYCIIIWVCIKLNENDKNNEVWTSLSLS